MCFNSFCPYNQSQWSLRQCWILLPFIVDKKKTTTMKRPFQNIIFCFLQEKESQVWNDMRVKDFHFLNELPLRILKGIAMSLASRDQVELEF